MKKINLFRVFVDVLMLIALVVTLATMRPPRLLIHTYAGFIFVGLFLLHMFLCRKWIIGITKSFKRAKPKVKVQYIINILLTTMWLSSLITGVFILLDIGMHGGRMDSARVHGITSVIACVFTVLHVFQHRKRLKTLLKRKNRTKKPIEKQAKGVSKKKIMVLKKVNVVVDILVVALLIIKLASTRHFPMPYSISGTILAILATLSMVLHIVVFVLKKQTITTSYKIMFLEQVLGTVLKFVCIVLGIFVSLYFPERYLFAGQSGRIMRELNPEFWGLFRAYMAVGIIACVVTAVHIGKSVAKILFFKFNAKLATRHVNIIAS